MYSNGIIEALVNRIKDFQEIYWCVCSLSCPQIYEFFVGNVAVRRCVVPYSMYQISFAW